MASKTMTKVADVNEDSGLGRPLPVKLTQIQRYEGQPRRFFDKESITLLADDIMENGQKTPVKVCKNSKVPGTFILIGGERRWRAFHLIMERDGQIPTVLCFIDAVRDEKHHFREALLDNLLREDLVPIDEAESYTRLYNESKADSHSAKLAEIAKFVKRSPGHVENYLFVHRLPASVKKLMDPSLERKDQLTITSAVDIARSTQDGALQLAIAKEAIERNLGVVETRSLIAIKTCKSGYGVSGRLRKPSDDYKIVKNFFGRTRNQVLRLRRSMNLDALYQTREDEDGDRARDARDLRFIIEDLQGMLREILGDEQKTP